MKKSGALSRVGKSACAAPSSWSIRLTTSLSLISAVATAWSRIPRCWSCETAPLLEKFVFLQLNRRPPSAISLPALWREASGCNRETLSSMLAQIRKQERKVAAVLLVAAASMLGSCATQRERVALVKDPDAKAEGAMPWNKQEKWESGGQFANFSDKR